MAIASVGSFGTFSSTSANQSSMAFVTSATLEVGNLAVLIIGLDNHQTTNGDEGAVSSITDAAGNTWTKADEFCNGNGSAQAGATCSIWYSKITSQLNSGATITINLTNNTSRDRTTATGWEYTITGNVAVEATNTLASDATSNPGSLNATTANIECLRVRGHATEDSATNANTATASWTNFTQATASSGGAASSMRALGEFIISTATGAASNPTYNGTINRDHASVYVAFKETAIAFTLVAAVGTFVLSGVAATLKSARQFAAAVGTFTLTGIAATLTWVQITAFSIAADVGSFALTGIATTLKSARLFAAAVGTYTFIGQAVSWGRGMGAFVGSYALTGVAALKHIVLTHVAGAYTFTGRAVSWGRSFTALATSFALNGVAVVWRRSIAHNVGAFTLTGRATFQKITKVVFAGAYTLTGQIATWGRGMAAAVGAYTFTGIGTGLAKMLRDIQFFKRRKVASKLASHRSGDPALVNRNHAPSLASRGNSPTLRRRLVED